MTGTVALSILALELPQAPDQLAAEHRDAVTLDELGRKALPVPLARALIEGHQEREYARAESRRRLEKQHQARMRELRELNERKLAQVPRGVPGVKGASAADVMLTGAVGPAEEFSGRRSVSVIESALGGAAGGTIGPTPEQRREAEAVREANRRARRGGK